MLFSFKISSLQEKDNVNPISTFLELESLKLMLIQRKVVFEEFLIFSKKIFVHFFFRIFLEGKIFFGKKFENVSI